jgi:hypothetical protein
MKTTAPDCWSDASKVVDRRIDGKATIRMITSLPDFCLPVSAPHLPAGLSQSVADQLSN